MTAVHTYPLSTALASAKAALCCPHGAPAAELAGHLMILEFYGTEDEQAYARDFASDMRHRDDLALWMDVVMVPPKRDLLPRLAPPETPAQVFHRHRKAWPMIGVASVVGAAVLMQSLRPCYATEPKARPSLRPCSQVPAQERPRIRGFRPNPRISPEALRQGPR